MAGSPATKKRGNGQGSISYNKSKNLWVAQYYAEGKRKTKYGQTKSEAWKKMTIAQGKIMNGTYFEPSKMNIEKWLKIWLNEYMRDKREPKTVENHESNIRNHINPYIGHIKLKDLKGYQVQQMYNKIAETLSGRTVNLVHITLHAALKQAIKNDLLIQNVTEKCTLLKHTPKKSRALTTSEQRGFVKIIKGDPFELAFLFCLYAGLRRGEVLALQWKDIDTHRMQLHIEKTISRVKNMDAAEGEKKSRIVVKKPKTKASNRIVPFSELLLPYIKNQRVKSAERKLAMGKEFNTNDYVFTDTKGNPLDGSCLNKQFNKLTKDIFSSHATVHTLRHTFVTRGAESNVSMKVMQELCGHSKIDITADIYTHVSTDFKLQEAAKIDVIL